VVTGEDGVRFYASMPFGRDESALARKQTQAWSDEERRRHVARRMYARRLGEVLPSADLNVLRGIEGARVRVLYRTLASQFGIKWSGRNYDRENPEMADRVNQALNHASAAVRAAAMIAVAATSTIPQLGFIHEDSNIAFCLDIADLYRESICLPAAFRAVKQFEEDPVQPLERFSRRCAGRSVREARVISSMIDVIKALLDPPGGSPPPASDEIPESAPTLDSGNSAAGSSRMP
jgi:CRISPR-associated protein Cas1